jgi:hypothetical protein
VRKEAYVAGASAQIDEIEVFIAALLDAGWTITFDWTVPVRQVGNASPDDPGIRRSAALADLGGVAKARVVWLVQPEVTSTSTGAWVELGHALAYRDLVQKSSKTIVVSGASRKCIFSDLADVRFESHEEALEYIIGLGKGE